MFQTKVLKKSKHTYHAQKVYFKNCARYEIMWKKHCRPRQATDDEMAHVFRMMST